MRILSTLALTLLTNSLQQVSARLAYPFVRSFGNDGEAWSPPKQTNLAEAEEASAITGSSPRPTEPPKPIFGRANLHARLDGYTLASDICGFKPSNGFIGCNEDGVSCNYQDSGYAGCCASGGKCSAVKRSCIEYEASATGACGSGKNPETLCCSRPSEGKCFTWSISLSGTAGKPSGVYSMLACSPSAGTGRLLDYDPAWSRTHFDTPAATVTVTQTASADNGQGISDKNNVVAIVGGTIGGAAVLVIIAATLCLCRRARKRRAAGSASRSKTSGAAIDSKPIDNAPFPAPTPASLGSSGYPAMQQSYDVNNSPYSRPLSPYQHSIQSRDHETRWFGGHQRTISSPDPSVVGRSLQSSPTPGVTSSAQAPRVELATNELGTEQNRAELSN